MCVVYFSLTSFWWVPCPLCPVVHTFYLACTQSVGNSKAKNILSYYLRHILKITSGLNYLRKVCRPRLKIIELCDVTRFLINIVLLSLSLLYLRKYRFKKKFLYSKSGGKTWLWLPWKCSKTVPNNQCCGSGSGRIRNFYQDLDPRIRKNQSGSEQLQIRKEFEVKLLWKTGKIGQYLNKNAQFKSIDSFLSKNSPLKSLNTLSMQEYKGKIYVKNIRKNSCRIRNRIRIRNQRKTRIRIKIFPDPQRWQQKWTVLQEKLWMIFTKT